MQTSATHRYIRIAPRKVRFVAEIMKGKKTAEAATLLRYTTKGAAKPLEKILKSAVASAKHNFQMDESNLYIAKVIVSEGPKLKRYRPRARGRAYPIQKKTSHITLVLEEITPAVKETASKTQETSVQGPAKSDNQKTRPKPYKSGSSEQSKFRPQKDMTKPKAEGIGKRIFRRKAV